MCIQAAVVSSRHNPLELAAREGGWLGEWAAASVASSALSRVPPSPGFCYHHQMAKHRNFEQARKVHPTRRVTRLHGNAAERASVALQVCLMQLRAAKSRIEQLERRLSEAGISAD